MASILKVDKIRVTGSDSDAISFDGNGVAIDAKLKTYMQALRDLPASASPKTDDAGELIADSITWPTRAS